VTTVGNLNQNRTVRALLFVILAQLCAKPARFHPNDRIQSRIISSGPVEHFHPNRVLFERPAVGIESLIYQEPQKPREPRRSSENRAAQNSAKAGTHLHA